MNAKESNPVVYHLPENEETYDALELAAQSLGEGSKSLVDQSLRKGDTETAREGILIGAEAEEVRENPPIMKYNGSLSK